MAQKTKSLNETPFILSLLKNADILKWKQTEPQATRLQKYQRSILELCLDIDSLFTMLDLTRLFLAQLHPQQLNYTVNIDTHDYLRYHLESYHVRVTTYKDILFKLINRVYQLNLVEKNGLKQNLLNTARKNNIPNIETIIINCDEALKGVSNLRNTIAHGGSYSSQELAIINAHNLLAKHDAELILTTNDYNEIMKGIVMRNASMIMRNNESMKMYLEFCLMQLYEVRLNQEEQLKEQDR